MKRALSRSRNCRFEIRCIRCTDAEVLTYISLNLSSECISGMSSKWFAINHFQSPCDIRKKLYSNGDGSLKQVTLESDLRKSAPGGDRTPDLRITSAPSATFACTAYKYDALTDCATGAPHTASGKCFETLKWIPSPRLIGFLGRILDYVNEVFSDKRASKFSIAGERSKYSSLHFNQRVLVWTFLCHNGLL